MNNPEAADRSQVIATRGRTIRVLINRTQVIAAAEREVQRLVTRGLAPTDRIREILKVLRCHVLLEKHNIADKDSVTGAFGSREHTDADVRKLTLSEGSGGRKGSLGTDPVGGLGVGLERETAVDWGGVGGDGTVDVDAALLGDCDGVVHVD